MISSADLDLEIPDPRDVPRRESLTGGPGHSWRWRGDDEARAAADRATAVADEWARGLDVDFAKRWGFAPAGVRTRDGVARSNGHNHWAALRFVHKNRSEGG